MGAISIWHIALILLVGFPITLLPALLPIFIKPPKGQNRFGKAPKSMDLVDSVKSCLQQFISAHGRASRSEFWYFFLFSFVFNIVLLAIILRTGLPFLSFLSYVVAIPLLMVSIRRLHDINRSGWWLLLQFGLGFITLIILWVLPSDKDTRHLEEVF